MDNKAKSNLPSAAPPPRMRDYTHYELLQQGAEGEYVCGHVDETPPESPGAYDSDDDLEMPCEDEWEECFGVQWTRLAVGITVLHVSSEGYFRLDGQPFFTVTAGLPQTGSPYKVVNVELERGTFAAYYAHDLVWRAFNGGLPDGWEVRHTNGDTHDNRLANLDMLPKAARPIDF